MAAASKSRELKMGLQLADKRALVTGSTSGIGPEIGRMLALEGVKVVVRNVVQVTRRGKAEDFDRAHDKIAGQCRRGWT